MRIIFLSHYFPPEVNAPASRTFEHCRLWAAAGHDVTVVTCAPNHPNGIVYPGYKNRWRDEETIGGIRVIRLWTFLAANEGFLLRTLNYLSYLISVTLAAPWLPSADIVISTSPQFFCGLAGLVIRRVKRAPWVLEIRDLWPESIITVGAMRRSLLIRWLEQLEALAYRRADRIVALTDSFVPHICARAGNRSKVAVVKNAVDLRRFDPAVKSDVFTEEHGLDGKFVAAYVGTHGMAHGLHTILDAARLLKHDPRIQFILVGDGAERCSLLKAKEEMGLENVTMIGQQPKEAMPAVWSATSASLILLRKNDLFKKVIPSKMFEAMAMCRPIILGVEGESRALLREAGAGIAITPECAEELAATVVRLADDPALVAALGACGREFVEANFDRRVLAARYLEILEQTMADGRAVRNRAVIGEQTRTSQQ